MAMTMNGAIRGAIAGTALFVGIATGPVWAGAPDTTPTPQAATCSVFAGRAGQLPCEQKYPTPHWMKKLVGTTFTGCALGLATGGPAGAGFGCLGGLASNIPY